MDHVPDPVRGYWTGLPIRHDEPVQHLDLWLATNTSAYFGRLTVGAAARAVGLVTPAVRWAGAALYDGGTIAYLATRTLDDDTDELGILVHGPEPAPGSCRVK